MFYSYSNETNPFAVAINVPRNQCQGGFDPGNLPTEENATLVRNDIYIKNNKFFNNDSVSDFIIAAGLKEECRNNKKIKIEPVNYLLQENASFSQLLNRTNDSCVVIYTAYSPCQNMTCMYNIKPALKTLKKHRGIKAFVFKKVYGLDENDHKCSSRVQNCTVPLYRFMNNRYSAMNTMVVMDKRLSREWVWCPHIMNNLYI